MELATKPLFLLVLLLLSAPYGADGSDRSPCTATSVPTDRDPAIKKPETPIEQLNAYYGANDANSAANNPTPQPPESTKSQFSIDDLLHSLQTIAIILGGLSAAYTFWKNSRNKTIETLITLEQEYRKHLSFLLQIEMEYSDVIKPVLLREASNDKSEAEDKKILRQLDGVLRHFYVCLQARKLCVINRKVLDEMCAYHLKMLSGSLEEPNKLDRMELADYVRKYWISIFRWAEALPRYPRQ